MNTKQLTDLDLAAFYAALTNEALERDLITKGYRQNANSLIRHVGRQVMAKAEQELKQVKTN